MLPATKTDTTTKATTSQVLQALASLAGLPARQADSEGIDKAAYHIAVEGVTRYALSEAVKAILRGALGHTFFPSPVELRRQCDAAIQPVHDQARRVERQREQARENAEFNRVIASRTPGAVARQQEAYRRFCDGYKATKGAENGPMLDPALVALVPDAPSSFKKAKVA